MAETGQCVSLIVSEAVSGLWGPFALKPALRTLLVNAATHGKGSPVALTGAQGRAMITIRDQTRAPFFRVDPARQNVVPGAAPDPAIARENIRRSGGGLVVMNHPEGGSEEKITLPWAPITVGPDHEKSKTTLTASTWR